MATPDELQDLLDRFFALVDATVRLPPGRERFCPPMRGAHAVNCSLVGLNHMEK
jgi:hypothetical protein